MRPNGKLATAGTELAQLTEDSARCAAPAAATRAEVASVRALTLTSAHLTIELEVTEHVLLGQLIPVQSAVIEVQASPRPGHPGCQRRDRLLLHPAGSGRAVPALLSPGRPGRPHPLDCLVTPGQPAPSAIRDNAVACRT